MESGRMGGQRLPNLFLKTIAGAVKRSLHWTIHYLLKTITSIRLSLSLLVILS